MLRLRPGYARETLRGLVVLLLVGFIIACINAVEEAENPLAPVNQYRIGGIVTGLVGSGLVLQNNLGDDVTLNAASLPVGGVFRFATTMDDLSDYSVSVATDPVNPNQSCNVFNGSGNLAGSDITNIIVDCAIRYPVSVTVSGYSTGNTMVLQINGADDLSLTSDGVYTFNTEVADSTAYSVTLVTPNVVLKTSCLLTNAMGTITGAPVTDVAVDCIDNIKPNVIATTPVGGATDVDPGTLINAAFDEDMLSSSIRILDVRDPRPNIWISGIVSYDVLSRTVSLTPNSSSRLEFFMPYTATLFNSITDLSGQALDSISWTFTTRDGIWRTAQLVESDNLGTAVSPQISLDQIGNGLAVWRQSNGPQTRITANHFNAYTGTWGTPEVIETDGLGMAAQSVQVDMFPAQNGMAVWAQSDGTRYNIWANNFDAIAGAWGNAQLVETDDLGHADNPQVAMEVGGHGLAVWNQSDGTRFSIWANRFDANSGTWGTAELIETNDLRDARYPQLARDLFNNGLVVWQQADASFVSNIWANYFDANTGTWGTAELIETENLGYAVNPQVAMVDQLGAGMAVWSQSDGARYNIVAARFGAVEVNTWETPEVIETNDLGDASFPQIAMDPAGNGLAVWYQSDGTRNNIWANRFDATTGTWGTAELIEAEDSSTAGARNPQVVLDQLGNGLAIWQQYDAAFNISIWVNRFIVATGTWGTPQPIETNNLGGAGNPQIALDFAGRARAVWQQTDGTRENIWSNRFD